jgi:hypothetical protein
METDHLHFFTLERRTKAQDKASKIHLAGLGRKFEQGRVVMKKLLISAIMLGTSVVFVPSIEAKATAMSASADPQIRVQIGRNNRRRWRRARTVTSTRIRFVGPWRYRETIRTTYFPNGRTRTVVIRRQRLNRYRNY